MQIISEQIIGQAINSERVSITLEIAPFDVGPGKIPDATFEAKGDLLLGTGPATYDNLPAGVNGYLLQADSTALLGVKWASILVGASMSLTNNSGSTQLLGTTVVIDPTGDDSFTVTTVAQNKNVFGVLLEDVVNGAAGKVGFGGLAVVNVAGNVVRGNFLVSSTTSGRAKDYGSALRPPWGAVGVALTGYSGGGNGTVYAILFCDVGMNVINKVAAIVELFGSSITNSTTNGCALPTAVEMPTNKNTYKVPLFMKDTAVEKILTGDFAADSNWTKGTGWTIGSGVATATAGSASDLSQTTAPLINAVVYVVTYTLTRTAGSITPKCGTQVGTSRSASGTYTEVITANGTAFLFSKDASFAGTLDNVSVKPIYVPGGEWTFELPPDYDGGTFTAHVTWWHPTATFNFNVAWNIAMVAMTDAGAIDVALGSPVQVNDVGGSANTMYKTPESAAITCAGTPLAGKRVNVKVTRVSTDSTNDTLASVGVYLDTVVLTYTRAG